MPPKVNPTHFHPTTPQASSKTMASRTLPGRASRLPNAPPAPPGETPQEKVARLRAAAARAKEAKISNVDRFLVRGRVWADKAHRFTVFTLMGFTGIATVVTIYALTDMMRYNRRKKAEWLIAQKQLHLSKLNEAREARAAGTATPEQLEFIHMEEKLDEWEEERRKQPGVLQKGKNWLFGGLKQEDVAAANREGGSEILKTVEEKKDEAKEVVEEKKGDFVESARVAWEKEKKAQEQGGMLDRLGTAVSGEEKPKSGSWTSWLSFR